jgi:hypothetical protein
VAQTDAFECLSNVPSIACNPFQALLLSEAQPKNALITPSQIQKQIQRFKSTHAFQGGRSGLTICHFYNFTFFKVRSTTEQMSALVTLKTGTEKKKESIVALVHCKSVLSHFHHLSCIAFPLKKN